MDFIKKLGEYTKAANAAVLASFPENDSPEVSGLVAAERYSLTAGGKRIRPIITLAFCELFGGNTEAALPYCAAIEAMHTASLIHDDLPAIDNDDTRRSLPTNHVKFGEATALLAGDGLFMDSFSLIASNPYLSDSENLLAVKEFAKATGSFGLVGGEYLDVISEGKSISLDTLKLMHSRKTGALIRVSAVLGAIAAGAYQSEDKLNAAKIYAERIGLAFQIIDDLLDRTSSKERLGKSVGKDEAQGKSTFLTHFTEEEAKRIASSLTDEAIAAVRGYEGSEFLVSLAEYLLEREF